MADSGDGLAGVVELLDELLGVLALVEVEEGAVATGVEDGGVLIRGAEDVLEGHGVLPDGVLEEVLGAVVLEVLDGAGVDGGFTTLGGGDGEFDALGL